MCLIKKFCTTSFTNYTIKLTGDRQMSYTSLHDKDQIDLNQKINIGQWV